MALITVGRDGLGSTSTSTNPRPSIGQENKVVRIADKSAGHIPFPGRPNIEASMNVFINNKGAHRKGDKWVIHCAGPICHDGKTASGSASVFVNGKPIARVGDTITCGDVAKEGSPNVFVGEATVAMATWASIKKNWKTEKETWDNV
jgi:uncharacterized Zn-binding protein involved in type VI secretion